MQSIVCDHQVSVGTLVLAITQSINRGKNTYAIIYLTMTKYRQRKLYIPDYQLVNNLFAWARVTHALQLNFYIPIVPVLWIFTHIMWEAALLFLHDYIFF